MRYLLLISLFILTSCSNYRNVSYDDKVYTKVVNEETKSILEETTLENKNVTVNVYNNVDYFEPLYVSSFNWNRYYWNTSYGWNYWTWNNWNWNYYGWHNNWYNSWNWNRNLYWNHPSYWNYYYYPSYHYPNRNYVWNNGRRGGFNYNYRNDFRSQPSRNSIIPSEPRVQPSRSNTPRNYQPVVPNTPRSYQPSSNTPRSYQPLIQPSNKPRSYQPSRSSTPRSYQPSSTPRSTGSRRG